MAHVERDNGGYIYLGKHYYLVNGRFYYYGQVGAQQWVLRDPAIIAILNNFIQSERLQNAG